MIIVYIHDIVNMVNVYILNRVTIKTCDECYCILFQDTEHVIITHNFTQSPDMFHVIRGDSRNESSGPLTFADNINGDWTFDETDTLFSYISE